MDDRIMSILWKAAKEQPDRDLFVAEFAPRQISVSRLAEIHHVVWTPFREIVQQAGMTQRAFAEHFCIPLRTVEDWARGVGAPPIWVKKLIVEKLRQEGLYNNERNGQDP